MKNIDVRSPFDNSIVGNVPFYDLDEVKSKINIAHETFSNKEKVLPKY